MFAIKSVAQYATNRLKMNWDKNLNRWQVIPILRIELAIAWRRRGCTPLLLSQKFTGSTLQNQGDCLALKSAGRVLFCDCRTNRVRLSAKCSAKKKAKNHSSLLFILLHILDATFYKFTDFFLALNQSFRLPLR